MKEDMVVKATPKPQIPVFYAEKVSRHWEMLIGEEEGRRERWKKRIGKPYY